VGVSKVLRKRFRKRHTHVRVYKIERKYRNINGL
jgi:hypothetical protein